MTTPHTTYTVTGINTDIVWQFKYRLDGMLMEFSFIEGYLTETQIAWLIKRGFPFHEAQIKKWKTIKNLNVEVGAPDLSFEVFWEAYGHKIKKIDTEKFWNKMPIKDRMDALNYIKTYNNYLARKHVAKVNPHRYLNKRYWEDNHASIH